MKTKKLSFWITALCLIIALIIAIYFLLPVYHYKVGIRLYEKEQYADSCLHLVKSNGYKDSEELLDNLEINYTKKTTKEYNNGTVVSRTESEYNKWCNIILEENYQNGNLVRKNEYEYDENGNITLDKSYYIDSGKTNTTRFEYKADEKNNLIMKTKYYSDDDETLKTEYEYEYDNDGNKIRQTILDSNGKTVSEFNKNGNIICKAEYDINGNLTSYYTYKYEYDRNGNEIFSAEYDKDGNIQNSNERVYDDKGNILINIQNGEKSVKEYDPDGKLLQETFYDKNGTVKYKYEYIENGKDYIQITYKENGEIESKSEWRYDEQGNTTDIIHFDIKTNEITQRTETEYNEYGHEVLNTTYDNNGDIFYEHKIVYEYNELGKIKYTKEYINGGISCETVFSEPVVVHKKYAPKPYQ